MFPLFSLDGITYMCHLGCSDKFISQMECYEHLYKQHSFEELKLWGINKDRIKDGLEEETDEIALLPNSYTASTEDLLKNKVKDPQASKKFT